MEKDSIVAPVQIVLDAAAAARQLVANEVQVHPGFADLYNKLGLLDIYDGRPDRAVRSFREALGINPGYFWAAANLAFALAGAGHEEEALVAFSPKGIFHDYPDFPLVRAALLLEVNEPDQAASILAEARDDHPFHTHLRALTALHRGDRQGAMAALLEAAKRSGALDRLYRQRELLGPSALERVSPRQAAAPIRIFPGLFELYEFFAEIYARHGFRNRAHQSFEEAQVLWPSPARFAWNQGRLASWMGDAIDARRGFVEAIEADPELVDAHLALGLEYAGDGNAPQAIREFERAAELRPGYADIRYQLGLAYVEVGRLSDAIGAFRAALSINPAFHFARQNLALALFRDGRLGQAIQEYDRLIAAGRRSADLYMQLGLAQVENGDAAEGEKMFRCGIEQNPDFALNYYHLGVACQRLGRREDARAAWKQFLDRNRQSDLAQEVLRQMEE